MTRAPVIDVHTHCWPMAAASDPRAWAAARGERHWADLVAPVRGTSLQGWADADRFLRDMDAAGVSQAVILGWYWERQETCDELNSFHAALLRAHPDRFLAFAAVNPAAGPRALDAVRRAVEDQGFIGLGEMLPPVQGFGWDDPTWLDILAWAESLRLPVNFHVTEALGRTHAGSVETPFRHFLDYATRFPELPIILAHWGGGIPFFHLNPHASGRLRNVWYDSAASPLLYDASVFRRVADLAGHERLLFGSDYPLRLHPRIDKEPRMDRFLDEARSSGLTPSELDAFLGGNFRRLLANVRKNPPSPSS